MASNKDIKLEMEWENKAYSKGSYPVIVTDGLFNEKNEAFAELFKKISPSSESRVFLVADQNVVQQTPVLGTEIGRYMKAYGITLAGKAVVLSGGEKIKYDGRLSAMRVLSAALQCHLSVNDVMVILGGGTVLDVAGHVATMIRGGVRVIRIPTTPEAQLEAGFADNAALDEGVIKDGSRIMTQPAGALIDPIFAKTTLEAVWRGGLNEAVRFACVKDKDLFEFLEKNAKALHDRDQEVYRELIRKFVPVRVKEGPTTFALWSALRLQSMSNYRLPHGYALGIASRLDGGYAVAQGLISDEDWQRICAVYVALGGLDCFPNSRRILHQKANILSGLDAWKLSMGEETIDLPKGIGKSTSVKQPDRNVLVDVIEALEIEAESAAPYSDSHDRSYSGEAAMTQPREDESAF